MKEIVAIFAEPRKTSKRKQKDALLLLQYYCTSPIDIFSVNKIFTNDEWPCYSFIFSLAIGITI